MKMKLISFLTRLLILILFIKIVHSSSLQLQHDLSSIARVVVSDDSLFNRTTPQMEDEESAAAFVQKLTTALNNAGLPASRRVMRQVAILDQLSCLPKVICGMNTKTPTSNTNLLNDYGFLIKYLFQKDDQEDEPEDDDQDDDERDVEYEEDEALRSEGLVAKRKGDEKNRKSPTKSDDESSEDGELDQMAQDELVDDEPEMMRYVLAEMNDKMNKFKPQSDSHGHVHKIHQSNYPLPHVDHSDLPGYDPESYQSYKNPTLNTASSQAILNEYDSSLFSGLKGGGIKFGNKNIQFKLGASDGGSSTLLGSLLPSFVYKKIKPDGHNPDDPFANDPFFADFKRRDLNLGRNLKSEDDESVQSQRINSRFRRIAYITEKKEELEKSTDPLTKYKVAEDVGRKTKSGRQCRLLFAKCPYEYNEIMTMIDNVKKVVTADTGLKQNGAQSDSGSTISTGSGNINLQTGPGGKPGVTQISHQLDNGDKVEIMLKIKPKDEGKQAYQIFHKGQSQELASADKSLTEMKKALQALVKLHNQTEAKILAQATLQGLTRYRPTLGPYKITTKKNLGSANPTSGLPKLEDYSSSNPKKIVQSDDQDDHDDEQEDQVDRNTSNGSSAEKSSEETRGLPKLKDVSKKAAHAGTKNKDQKQKKGQSEEKENEDNDDNEGSEEDDQEEGQDEEEEDNEPEDDPGNYRHDKNKMHPGRPNGFPARYRPSGPGQQQPPHFYRKQPTSGPFYNNYHRNTNPQHSRPHPPHPSQQSHQQKRKPKPKISKQRTRQEPKATSPTPKNPTTKKPENVMTVARQSSLPPLPSAYKIIRPRNRQRPRNDKGRSGIKVIPKIITAGDHKPESEEFESR